MNQILLVERLRKQALQAIAKLNMEADQLIVAVDGEIVQAVKLPTVCYGNPKKLWAFERPKKVRKKAQWKQETRR